MEIFGGNGYVDDGPMARLFREAPVNSIWEGSGNVMCLDVLRALAREPEAGRLLLEDLGRMAGAVPRLRAEWQALCADLAADATQAQAQARNLAMRLVLLAQACLLRESAPAEVADAFVATRLGARWGRVAGAFDACALPVDAILQRAYPEPS
jgi:putative acyl-CoA dehydrogenase